MWDIGGQDKIRALWRHYFVGVNAVIYVVDSADRERIAESQEELQKILQETELRGCSLLVLANKMDLPNAMSVGDVTSALGLVDIKSRPWHVQPCIATTATGLNEGLEWLAKQLAASKK